MSHKTHDNSDNISRISIKPTVITPKRSKAEITPGVGFVAVRAPSVEEHRYHARTQLRTHARTHAGTHDTNTKRNRNRFPDSVQLTLLSPQSPIV